MSDKEHPLYLLDANVLIDAHRDYYPIERVPEFWSWLIQQGRDRRVAIPVEQCEEIKNGKDRLAMWIKRPDVKEALVLKEEADPATVTRVVTVGYAADLTDDELEQVGNDPFLISYALSSHTGRCVVTTESSRPRCQRANRHIPDVCRSLSLRCCNTFEFLRSLDFRTNWQGSESSAE